MKLQNNLRATPAADTLLRGADEGGKEEKARGETAIKSPLAEEIKKHLWRISGKRWKSQISPFWLIDFKDSF